MCVTNSTGKQGQDIQSLIPGRGRRILTSAKCLILACGCTCPVLCIPGVPSLGRVAMKLTTHHSSPVCLPSWHAEGQFAYTFHSSKHCIHETFLSTVTHTNTLIIHSNLILRFRDIQMH